LISPACRHTIIGESAFAASSRERWQLLRIAHRGGTSLPPISVYELGTDTRPRRPLPGGCSRSPCPETAVALIVNVAITGVVVDLDDGDLVGQISDR
jgi:hypothetical protein